MSSSEALPPPGVELPAGYRMTELDLADKPRIQATASWAFAHVGPPEEEVLRVFQLQPGRMVGIWAPGEAGGARDSNDSGDSSDSGDSGAADPGVELAAFHASYAFTTFGVPGGVLPAAGLTWVSVHPAHRRRGLGRAMVTTHLARTAERGEALSALFSSEPGIYGRFGYGRASHHVSMTLHGDAVLREPPGAQELRVSVEAADFARHGADVSRVHDAVTRPGWARRTTPELEASVFQDLPSEREGGEPLRLATVWTPDGEPRGYAFLSRRSRWSRASMPEGVTTVREAVALDGAAAYALWTFLRDLDLMTRVDCPMLAVDDPLVALLVDTRSARMQLVDNVWLRLVDLPAALAGRSYAAEADVVLEVHDDALPANDGRWRLRARAGAPGAAGVEPTGEPADLALDTAELAAAYLGGTSLAALGAAGLVEERTPGALGAASAALAWHERPVTSWVF